MKILNVGFPGKIFVSREFPVNEKSPGIPGNRDPGIPGDKP